MKKIFLPLPALALTGAMVLTLAACGNKAAETPVPEDTATPQVTESVTPTETPEPTAEPSESVEPAESDAPSTAPIPTPGSVQVAPIETAPAETGGETADEGSKVQAVWDAIATRELPYFMDLDDDLLSQLYGIDAADLVEYIGKMPLMNTQATEFFIAQVQPDKMDTVKAALEKRQADLEEQWKQYLPDQLELVQNYKLVTSGDYILFAIAECADEAVNEFEAIFTD